MPLLVHFWQGQRERGKGRARRGDATRRRSGARGHESFICFHCASGRSEYNEVSMHAATDASDASHAFLVQYYSRRDPRHVQNVSEMCETNILLAVSEMCKKHVRTAPGVARGSQSRRHAAGNYYY